MRLEDLKISAFKRVEVTSFKIILWSASVRAVWSHFILFYSCFVDEETTSTFIENHRRNRLTVPQNGPCVPEGFSFYSNSDDDFIFQSTWTRTCFILSEKVSCRRLHAGVMEPQTKTTFRHLWLKMIDVQERDGKQEQKIQGFSSCMVSLLATDTNSDAWTHQVISDRSLLLSITGRKQYI